MYNKKMNGHIVPSVLNGCKGQRYFDEKNLYIEVEDTNREDVLVFWEVCKMIWADTSILNSFPPCHDEALKPKIHVALDMVLETMNEGKLQTTLSPTLIKKRMRAYLKKK